MHLQFVPLQEIESLLSGGASAVDPWAGNTSGSHPSFNAFLEGEGQSEGPSFSTYPGTYEVLPVQAHKKKRCKQTAAWCVPVLGNRAGAGMAGTLGAAGVRLPSPPH